MPVTLREIYPSVGKYSAKLLIKPTVSSGVLDFSVTMRDADGVEMPIGSKRWGTKLNVNFEITDRTPDGVALIEIKLRCRDRTFVERQAVWVIK